MDTSVDIFCFASEIRFAEGEPANTGWTRRQKPGFNCDWLVHFEIIREDLQKPVSIYPKNKFGYNLMKRLHLLIFPDCSTIALISPGSW